MFIPNISLNFRKRHKNEYVIIITINCWLYNKIDVTYLTIIEQRIVEEKSQGKFPLFRIK